VVFCPPLASPVGRVKATRLFKPSKRDRSVFLSLTVGALNYAEREHVKRCKKIKIEPMRIWLKWDAIKSV
jgi:hypothetical protein